MCVQILEESSYEELMDDYESFKKLRDKYRLEKNSMAYYYQDWMDRIEKEIANRGLMLV